MYLFAISLKILVVIATFGWVREFMVLLQLWCSPRCFHDLLLNALVERPSRTQKQQVVPILLLNKCQAKPSQKPMAAWYLTRNIR
ncbi:hypothetical protein P167DRAFT_66701 [Morchella conica CCBAS932]|uniref:Uncharacterized protein n=1 Tax=Morchella conica CCBAS932 TaxID=1392247 RepID=A0A3N4KUW4_9PEZI|nr:hypothetical protein P167DRAFT_66701 [Morchella conica CCBAS932]